MKPFLPLLAALGLFGPLASAAPPKDPMTPLESATVELSIAGSISLQEALAIACEQLPQRPSIVYKPGAESLPVPQMKVEQVRFGDLLAALEELLPVRFTIKNPTPQAGENPLIIIESAARPGPYARSLPAGSMTGEMPAAPGDLASAYGSTGEVPPSKDSPAGAVGGGGAERRAEDSAKRPAPIHFGSAPRQVRDSSRATSATWTQTLSAPPQAMTQTYAIGSIVNSKGAPPAQDIIEAINLVWTTANLPAAKGDDAPRVALHEPSSLLIIKAPPAWQGLADEVVSNLLKEHHQQLQQRSGEAEIRMIEERFRREIDHREQLTEILTERLKADHAAEVDKMRAKLQELEAQISILQTRLKAGG